MAMIPKHLSFEHLYWDVDAVRLNIHNQTFPPIYFTKERLEMSLAVFPGLIVDKDRFLIKLPTSPGYVFERFIKEFEEVYTEHREEYIEAAKKIIVKEML